mmetsp:Transcript_18867/g.30658  ORF Transcript_18867/g.30658 Transcript_18867/m.30658 type:complete len:205 (+) Transcript_18867:296-910(+)
MSCITPLTHSPLLSTCCSFINSRLSCSYCFPPPPKVDKEGEEEEEIVATAMVVAVVATDRPAEENTVAVRETTMAIVAMEETTTETADTVTMVATEVLIREEGTDTEMLEEEGTPMNKSTRRAVAIPTVVGEVIAAAEEKITGTVKRVQSKARPATVHKTLEEEEEEEEEAAMDLSESIEPGIIAMAIDRTTETEENLPTVLCM